MRVLVVHPPALIARDFIDYPYFADLGAVQLAAVVRARGHEVVLVDAYALPRSGMYVREDRRHLGAPLDDLGAPIAAAGAVDAVVVAYTPFHRPPHRDALYAGLLRGIRAIHGRTPIVLADAYQSGQHYVESDGVLAAYPEADAWVKYEAEVTVPALLDALAGGERPAGIHRGVRPERLDDLPDPAWDLVDLDAHDAFRASVIGAAGRPRWAFPIDGRTMPMITSRGCPYRCAHCSSNPDRAPGEVKTQRRLSPARVDAAMARLKSLGATRVAILDELLNVNRAHFDAVLTSAEKHGLALEIPNGLRADHLTREHVERLGRRVTTISVSAESGVQRVLDEIVGKDLDPAAIEHVAGWAHELSVPLLVHFIIGMPGERAEEIAATLTWAADLHARFAIEPAVQYATPLPGTRLAEGRSLPVIKEWGPAFQKRPSQPGMLVDALALETFKHGFERRVASQRGADKLIVNLTYACNNHCTFCAVGTRDGVHGDADRQREFLQIYRDNGVRMVDFDGGEPTLHPEVLEIIGHARSIGYERITITTNGRRAQYEDFAKALVTSGITTLLFSVHGNDARSHAQQVGVAEAFDQTVAGIRNCVRLAPSTVEIGMNVTITKGNQALLPDIAELALSLGLAWINLQFLTPFGRATKWIAPDENEATASASRTITEYGDRIRFQVINLPFCMMPEHAHLLTGDLGKLARHMAFVNNESVNLADYLAERRVRKPVCGPCPHQLVCGGFYELDDVPEPPWKVAEEDRVGPIRALPVIRG